MKEIKDIVNLLHNFKVQVWKEFSLNQIKEAVPILLIRKKLAPERSIASCK